MGGLPTAVGDAGVLVDGHRVGPWTDAVESLLLDRPRRLELGRQAVDHASRYGWAATTDRLVEVYRQAIRGRQSSGNESPIDEGRIPRRGADGRHPVTADAAGPRSIDGGPEGGVDGAGDGAVDGAPADRAPAAEARLTAYLDGVGIGWELGGRAGEYVVTLPGEKKLKTVVSLLVRDRTTSLSAFVIRNPDENHEAFYRTLLRKNLRLQGVAYAIDTDGDVYLPRRAAERGARRGAPRPAARCRADGL